MAKRLKRKNYKPGELSPRGLLYTEQWRKCGERWARWLPLRDGMFRRADYVDMMDEVTKEEKERIVQLRMQGFVRIHIGRLLSIPYQIVDHICKLEMDSRVQMEVDVGKKYEQIQRRLLYEFDKRTNHIKKLMKMPQDELLGYLKHCRESIATIRAIESTGEGMRMPVETGMNFAEDLKGQPVSSNASVKGAKAHSQPQVALDSTEQRKRENIALASVSKVRLDGHIVDAPSSPSSSQPDSSSVIDIAQEERDLFLTKDTYGNQYVQRNSS